MFMRVSSRCAHQLRPPVGRIQRRSAVGGHDTQLRSGSASGSNATGTRKLLLRCLAPPALRFNQPRETGNGRHKFRRFDRLHRSLMF
jgi:hypothetical protein